MGIASELKGESRLKTTHSPGNGKSQSEDGTQTGSTQKWEIAVRGNFDESIGRPSYKRNLAEVIIQFQLNRQ